MPKFTVTDTITFERTWKGVDAENEEAAIAIIDDGLVECDEEKQTDNTPYNAELED